MGFFISIVVTLAVLLFEAVESGTSLGRTNGKNKFKETDNINLNDWKE